MKKRSIHKIQKELKRELKHKAWLEKNLKNTTTLMNNKKRVLKLYTELAFKDGCLISQNFEDNY